MLVRRPAKKLCIVFWINFAKLEFDHNTDGSLELEMQSMRLKFYLNRQG